MSLEDASAPRMFASPTKKRQRKADISADTPRDVRNARTIEVYYRTIEDREYTSEHDDALGSASEPDTNVERQEGAADDAATDKAVEEASTVLSPAETTTFRGLGLSDWLDKVCKSLGMNQPTQVQTGCIPAILAGRSAIGTAHTGSGKTAAFALPILQLLAKDPFGVFGLVLTPTRCDHYSVC